MGWNSPYEDRTEMEVKILIPLEVSGHNLGGNSLFLKGDEHAHPLQSW